MKPIRTRKINSGYMVLTKRTRDKRLIKEHVVIAERALGKPLPKNAVVHHVNGDRADNRPSNLVICQDSSYHRLLHIRMNAKKACGNPNYRSCSSCKTYDDPNNLIIDKNNNHFHRACKNRASRERYQKNKKAINEKRNAKRLEAKNVS